MAQVLKDLQLALECGEHCPLRYSALWANSR